MAYTITFEPAVSPQIDALTARQFAIVLDAIQVHLVHQPSLSTRNRKPLRPNTLASWELRLGDLRIVYHIAGNEVRIVAIGRKRREYLMLGDTAVRWSTLATAAL